MSGSYNSKQVGTSADGYVLYEALVELSCTECDGPIGPGERFIRRARHGGGYRRYEYCGSCADVRPFPPAGGAQDQ